MLSNNHNIRELLRDNITKHIDENIWELRPGNNRIFCFYWDENNFIIKKGRFISMKTWENYKEYIKNIDSDSGKDIADIEEQASIISEMIKQRNALG